MFFIYDQNNQSIKEIKYRPFLEGLKANMNYYSATNIAANPERNVIVTAMYHMDLVHLYDFQGNLKKSIQFSENPVPRVNEEREALALEEGYNGTSFIFPSENYLYLKRSHVEVEKRVVLIFLMRHLQLLNLIGMVTLSDTILLMKK